MNTGSNTAGAGDVRLRPATIDDLARLENWDREAHVIASDPDDDWNWATELLRDPVWRAQLIAEVRGVPMGFVQIIDPGEEESHYWGEIETGSRAIDIWIGPAEYLGRGYGTAMMRLALAICFSSAEVNQVWIDPLASNQRAIRFYRRLGFEPIERRQLGGSDCEVHRLSRTDWARLRATPVRDDD